MIYCLTVLSYLYFAHYKYLMLTIQPSFCICILRRILFIHSFIRFFNENTVITQWFNNMQ